MVDKMLEPEQILHASMILTVESEDSNDDELILQVQEALGCDSSDYDAAMSHIKQHRDDGNWGGRSEAVLHRSRERLREAMNTDALPSTGSLADSLNTLIGDDGDDGEIDPFAELGVSSSGGSFGATSVESDDPLAAFMDDEEEGDLVDESGFLASESSSSVVEDEEQDTVEVPDATVVAPEEEIEEAPVQEISPTSGYEMLMSTCWIDGILDPAEAKLLARKREELGITFEEHLEMLRDILGNSS
ncbi:MAG TPA: hypothetical protein D7H97_03820 [Candidatus Poseidoniales archaeon]|jgi:hypothetical protein|nr:MAG TPA: hypothetical protein D7H97_03820 [Candidatus Poseidoniales archaeon]|tara:strand:+ start:548 stop:1285 length:738 start_codon:yes stop_codon:yes gene_type:complete